MRTFEMSLMARDISCPVGQRSKKAKGCRNRRAQSRLRRSYSIPRLALPVVRRRPTAMAKRAMPSPSRLSPYHTSSPDSPPIRARSMVSWMMRGTTRLRPIWAKASANPTMVSHL